MIDQIARDFSTSGISTTNLQSLLSNVIGSDPAEICANICSDIGWKWTSNINGLCSLTQKINLYEQSDNMAIFYQNVPNLQNILGGDLFLTLVVPGFQICYNDQGSFTSFGPFFENENASAPISIFQATYQCAAIAETVEDGFYITTLSNGPIVGNATETGC